MNDEILLRVDGDVERPLRLSWRALAAIDAAFQIEDIGLIDPKRNGGAVRLAGVLQMTKPLESAAYLTLHATADDFHASVPLSTVRDRGLLIYRIGDHPLPAAAGGPVRFHITDFAACHTDEIDECANVKFVDRIELSVERGYDNRPQDDQQHEALHEHDKQA